MDDSVGSAQTSLILMICMFSAQISELELFMPFNSRSVV